MQLELLQPLHDGRPLLPPLLVTTSPPSIPARPALAPWCRVVEDDARVLVEHGGTLVTLEGRAAGSLLPALLPLLDGTRTVDDVGAAVGERARPAVDRALELLAHHRLLVDGPRSRARRSPSSDPAGRRTKSRGSYASSGSDTWSACPARRWEGLTSWSRHPRPTTRRSCRRSTVPASRRAGCGSSCSRTTGA